MARTPKPSGPGGYPATRADLLARLTRAGWTIEKTRGQHIRVTPPNGAPWVVFPSTGSDIHGIRRTCADIRRVTGVDLRTLR